MNQLIETLAEDIAIAAAALAQSTVVPIDNEPMPRLIVEPPLPGPLAQGVVFIPYRVENLRILPVAGPAARNVSPRVGHLHITVDDLPWLWADFGQSNTIVLAGMPRGQHKVLIELVDAEGNVFTGTNGDVPLAGQGGSSMTAADTNDAQPQDHCGNDAARPQALWCCRWQQAQQPGITRTDLTRSDLSVPGREVIQVLVEFAPGGVAARHSHPGEEIVYVVEGALEYLVDGKPPVTLKAGEGLFIPAGGIHAVRNVGAGKGVRSSRRTSSKKGSRS